MSGEPLVTDSLMQTGDCNQIRVLFVTFIMLPCVCKQKLQGSVLGPNPTTLKFEHNVFFLREKGKGGDGPMTLSWSGNI